MEEMSRWSAWRAFGVVVRVRRLDDTQRMLPSVGRRPDIRHTIDETWVLSEGLRRKGEIEDGRGAAAFWLGKTS